MPADKIQGNTLIFNFECKKGDNNIIMRCGKRIEINRIVTQKEFSMSGGHIDTSSGIGICLQSKASKVLVIK